MNSPIEVVLASVETVPSILWFRGIQYEIYTKLWQHSKTQTKVFVQVMQWLHKYNVSEQAQLVHMGHTPDL